MVVAGVFLGAGVNAFLRSPAHGFSVRRLRAVGFGALIAVLVPMTGGVAWAVHVHFAFEPGDPGVQIAHALPSPDGRLLAVQLSRVIRPAEGESGTNRPAGSEAFVYEVATGRQVYRSGQRTSFNGWAPDGSLAVFGLSRVSDPFKSGRSGALVDPRSGTRKRSITQAECNTLLVRIWPNYPSWVRSKYGPKRADKRRVTYAWMDDASSEDAVTSFARLAPLQERGKILIVNEAGEIVLHDLVAGTKRVLVDNSDTWSLAPSFVSRSQSYFVAFGEKEVRVVEIATGRTRLIQPRGPEQRLTGHWCHFGPTRDLFVVKRVGSASELSEVVKLHDFTSGVTFRPDVSGHGRFAHSMVALKDGRVVLSDQSRVELYGSDGRFERTIYAPRSGEER